MEGTKSSLNSYKNIRHRLMRLSSLRNLTSIKPEKKPSCWDKYLIHPDSKFKTFWDLVVIILSVYNSLLIPYEFAYSVNYHVVMDVLDRMIDVGFIIDIFINFRTMYRDSRTDDVVTSGK